MKQTSLKIFTLFVILVISGCVKDEPGFGEYNVGVGLFQAGDYEGAVSHFRSATVQNPAFAEAFMNLGTSLYRLERYTEAIDAYETADSLFRSGEFVEIRGTDHAEKIAALEEMIDVTWARITLLDSEHLSEEEIEELKKKIEPLQN
jgi:tetratricopeptide (TPR) repeat protein